MTGDAKVLGYLGLAARGRLIESGEFSTEKAVKSGRAFLVITANDASENTKKNFRDMCAYYGVPYAEFADKQTLGHAIGRQFRASCALTDEKLAGVVAGVLETEMPEKRRDRH